jgi:ribonuclease E
MVYVPDGGSAGISRKLPDAERTRLRSILKKITPEDAGVIVRTAAEGASEDELAKDIARLSGQWEDIQKKSAKASPPSLLYGEPDLVIRVIRDIFNEDFNELIVQGEHEWQLIHDYVESVAPDLLPRLRQETTGDVFAEARIDEQLLKALDRKVYLPSGGSLVFDRTEAMTVVDVNTGRFTGKGGNLEETVTKNNLEAAEELVRQLRLRDVGGIIVVDFIDMVLESNRELVLRRLTECLGRDRTKHQVAEVTSLGLVQMTRKRVGQGLLEAYSEPCPTCGGRGHTIELPGLGGVKPRPKPIPRPPAARPLLEDGESEDDGAATGDDGATDSENGSAPTVPIEVEEEVEAIEAAESPETAETDDSAEEQAEAHSADVLVE